MSGYLSPTTWFVCFFFSIFFLSVLVDQSYLVPYKIFEEWYRFYNVLPPLKCTERKWKYLSSITSKNKGTWKI